MREEGFFWATASVFEKAKKVDKSSLRADTLMIRANFKANNIFSTTILGSTRSHPISKQKERKTRLFIKVDATTQGKKFYPRCKISKALLHTTAYWRWMMTLFLKCFSGPFKFCTTILFDDFFFFLGIR